MFTAVTQGKNFILEFRGQIENVKTCNLLSRKVPAELCVRKIATFNPLDFWRTTPLLYEFYFRLCLCRFSSIFSPPGTVVPGGLVPAQMFYLFIYFVRYGVFELRRPITVKFSRSKPNFENWVQTFGAAFPPSPSTPQKIAFKTCKIWRDFNHFEQLWTIIPFFVAVRWRRRACVCVTRWTTRSLRAPVVCVSLTGYDPASLI